MADCVYRTCFSCNGTGIQNVIVSGTGDNPVWGDITCQQCNGDKLILWGDISGTDIEGIADILSKCDDILSICNAILTQVS